MWDALSAEIKGPDQLTILRHCVLKCVYTSSTKVSAADVKRLCTKDALDKSVAAGKKKECYIYRLLTCGTVEERVFQKQLQKETLSQLTLSTDEVKHVICSGTY